MKAQGIGLLVVFAIVLGVVAELFEAIKAVFPVVLLLAVALGIFLYKQAKKAYELEELRTKNQKEKKLEYLQKKLEYLRNKYQDESLVQRINDGYFWEGQSAEQLRDSLGGPYAVDKKILKTKKKEVWKYGHRGANRFGLRVTLEDDVVVGWENKA